MKNIIAFISVLTCSSIILFVISQSSARVLATFDTNSYYSSNTSMGKVTISSLQKEPAEKKVYARINKWKKQKNIRLTFLNNKLEVTNNAFQFLVPDSFQTVQKGKENPLVVEINSSEIRNELRQLGMGAIVEEVDINKLKKLLQQYAANLSETKLEIDMEKYLVGFNENKKSNLSTVIVSIDNQTFMKNWMEDFNTIVIKPNSYFSLRKTLSNQMNNYINDYDSISAISSNIYKAALKTNLQIVERNIGYTLPSNVELGNEAFVDNSNMDLRFYNPSDYQLTIKSKSISSNKLEIVIEGPTIPLKYLIVKENKTIFQPRKIVDFENDQDKFKNKAGKIGYSIDVYKEIYLNDLLIERQFVSNDVYLPINEVIYKSNSSFENNDVSTVTNSSTDINENNIENDMNTVKENLYENSTK